MVFLLGLYTFLRKQASITDTFFEKLTTSLTITYKNIQGASISEHTTSTIKKVSPLKISTSFRGKTIVGNNSKLDVDLIDSSLDQTIGTFPTVMGENNMFEGDWTSIANINPLKTFDLRIHSPGFLSRKMTDISLLSLSSELQAKPLVAGDVNQDQLIDVQDYLNWKSSYGQQNVVNNPKDFNGDGVINYKDYAISFGTPCYGATEINQDTKCK
ncbi:MAG: hypothetical protein WCO23_01880 [bacterium]